jgi:hypothetical protein
MNYGLAIFAGLALTVTAVGVMNDYDIIDVVAGSVIQIRLEKIPPQSEQSLPIGQALPQD